MAALGVAMSDAPCEVGGERGVRPAGAVLLLRLRLLRWFR